MELIVKILSEGEKRKFPAECNDCGWIGSSGECGTSKGHPESGCSGDIHCPMCNSSNIDAIDNEQPIASFIDRLKKSNSVVKKLTEQSEAFDATKFVYEHFEKENKEMKKEIERLKQLLENPTA